MRLKTLLLTISAILVINPCYAQEVIAELDETGKVVLNEELRNTRNLIKQNETAIVPFSRGGLGADIDAQSEGTIFVVDSTGIAAEGLAPGVSGQTLKISGSAPIWETVVDNDTHLSNVILSSPTLISQSGDVYVAVIVSKFKMMTGIRTLTVWARLKSSSNSSWALLKTTVDSLTALTFQKSVDSDIYEWFSGDIDVSSLTPGTTYDITIEMKSNDSGQTAYCLGYIIIAS